MQVVAHNLMAQFTNRELKINTENKGKSTERLSSGYKINKGADDAAGLTISEKMRGQIRGLNRGTKNIVDGISWVQTADGALEEMHSITQRIRELAVQASNDTNTEADRMAIDKEINQLKKEINRCSTTTQFNGQDIFDNSYVQMDIEGTPGDLTVFDASYDAATGDVEFGGFLFHGERITWDTVSPGMVTTDANGQQVFVGGDYTYVDGTTGYTFQISCEDGDLVPKITRTIDVSADASGIKIDGKNFDWSMLKDEDGNGLTSSNIGPGTWYLEYEGATVGFFIPNGAESIEDIAKAINSAHNGKVSYTWKTVYAGQSEETAVRASFMKNLQISNQLANSLASASDLKYIVRADETNGIWLENAAGTKIANSEKSWADLGITSWDSGHDISSAVTYEYKDDNGGTMLSFDFFLSDVTSVDSVVDGLDGMEISGKNIKTNYSTNLNMSQDNNLLKATLKSNNTVYFQEEKEFGRDFDQKEIDDIANANIGFDGSTHKAELEFKDAAGNGVISYQGDTSKMEGQMEDDIRTYLNYIEKKKIDLVLAGIDLDTADLSIANLTDLLNKNGGNHITTSGYFDSTVTIDGNNMVTTDGSSGYKPGLDGKTYPTAFIDFSGLGTDYMLSDLEGLGFNSTCKTCSNHYSVVFSSGVSGETTDSGYKYNFRSQGSQDYLLKIDLDSLKAQGVTTGADLAKAIVEITSKAYDFHYTQYAAAGGTLYVHDDREQSSGTRAATFDTAPYYSMDTDVYDISLSTGDGRKLDLSYTYQFKDAAARVKVEMAEAADGEYVKKSNPDGTTSYVKYKAEDFPDPANQPKRYAVNVSYAKSDGSNGTFDDAVSDYAADAVKKMLTNSNIQLDAKDYTYMDVNGQNKPNVAIRAEYESVLEETPYENGMHIQTNSRAFNAIKIPRFPMNTMVLKLYKAGTKTYEQAQNTIAYADFAIACLSEKRSLYGACQNRMEKAYNINQNSEENTTAAESRIRDADMASEMVVYSKNNILGQIGQSVLAQANQVPQNVLQLLQ